MKNNQNTKEQKSGKWGGPRPNSGRPKGSYSEEQKERIRTESEMNIRIMENVHRVLGAQLSLALGNQYLFKIETDEKGKKSKAQMVTSQDEIQSYINGEIDDPDCYYFITTEKPNIQAIQSLFDRAYGKAVQKVALTDPQGNGIIDIEKAKAIALTFNNAKDDGGKSN